MSSFRANIMPTGNNTASASSNVITLGNSEIKQLRTRIIALFEPEDCFNADEVMMLPPHVASDRQAQARRAAASAKKAWKFRL
jgi:spore coat polysaccharide biosynthesis predicted glycosyltransferase SpsG